MRVSKNVSTTTAGLQTIQSRCESIPCREGLSRYVSTDRYVSTASTAAVIYGMAVRAAGGATRKELRGVAEIALQTLHL